MTFTHHISEMHGLNYFIQDDLYSLSVTSRRIYNHLLIKAKTLPIFNLKIRGKWLKEYINTIKASNIRSKLGKNPFKKGL